MPEIIITKANGQAEAFDVAKLEHSLRKADASEDVIDKVLKHVIAELKSGMTTEEIYRKAFAFLHNIERPLAMRYSLKRAIMDLGPSGFPFEQLIARLFKKGGYTVETDKVINGGCADHEIDIIAYNEKKLIMIEAKFHNSVGINSDLKVALYIKARLDDLKKVQFNYGFTRGLNEGWLVTNTKFTSSAIKYAECQGITMVGWNYPLHHTLQEMIEAAELHPLTCLTSLTPSQKQLLLTQKIIACTDITNNRPLLRNIGLTEHTIDTVEREIELLYN